MFTNIIHDHEAEAQAYVKIGKSIAGAGDHQAVLFLKDRYIEEGESFNALRATLKKFADQIVFKFLGEDKFGREIALRTHYKPAPVSNEEMVTSVIDLRAQLFEYDPKCFGENTQQREFIDDFERRIQGVIEQISHAARHAKPIPASQLGM